MLIANNTSGLSDPAPGLNHDEIETSNQSTLLNPYQRNCQHHTLEHSVRNAYWGINSAWAANHTSIIAISFLDHVCTHVPTVLWMNFVPLVHRDVIVQEDSTSKSRKLFEQWDDRRRLVRLLKNLLWIRCQRTDWLQRSPWLSIEPHGTTYHDWKSLATTRTRHTILYMDIYHMWNPPPRTLRLRHTTIASCM